MIRITHTGGNQIRAVLLGTVGRLEDLSQPLVSAGTLVRDESINHIKIGGDPAWPPSKKTEPNIDSKAVSKSIGIMMVDQMGAGGGGQTGVNLGTMMSSVTDVLESPHRITVGSSVRTADGKFNYAQIFQEGSGIFAGHSSWQIRPVGGSVLAWSAGGRTFFARSVVATGQPARPWLYFDGLEPKINNIFDAWIRRGSTAAE